MPDKSSKDRSPLDVRVENYRLHWTSDGGGSREATSAEVIMWAEIERLRAHETPDQHPDTVRLEWLLRNVSGAEWRRLGVLYGDGPNRTLLNDAMAASQLKTECARCDGTGQVPSPGGLEGEWCPCGRCGGSGADTRPANACWCHKCNPNPWPARMILCPDCGNKRCPKASDHNLACTNSNAPGQPGSVYA